MLTVFGTVSLSAGCIPALRTVDEPRVRLRFVDQQSRVELRRLLVLTAFEDYFGWRGPDGGLSDQPTLLVGVKAHYFAQPRVWDSEQKFAFRFTVALLASPLFFVLPVGYGGSSETDGLLLIAPGYLTTYVPGTELYFRPDGEKDDLTITMSRAEGPEEEIARARQWFRAGSIHVNDLARCRIVDGENYKLPPPAGSTYGLRLNSSERQMVLQFLDECVQAPLSQSTITRPP